MSDPTAPAHEDRSHALAVVGLVVAVAVALLLTTAVGTDGARLRWFDEPLMRVTRWADGLGWPVEMARILGTLTQPAPAGVGVAVLALWLLRAGRRPAAAMLAVSGVGGAVLTTAVKNLVDRERPASAAGLVRSMSQSFPSGHSSAGIYLFMAAGVVLLQLGRATPGTWLRRVGMGLVLLGPLIGVSRLVLGAHWASDVVGGWAYGSSALLVAALVLWTPLGRGWPAGHQVGRPGAARQRG